MGKLRDWWVGDKPLSSIVWDWFEGDPNQRRPFMSIFIVTLLVWLAALCWSWYLAPLFFVYVLGVELIPKDSQYPIWMLLVNAPLFEELIFRCLLTLWLTMRWEGVDLDVDLGLRKKGLTKEKKIEELVLVVVISSVVFGLIHGSYYNIYIQGVGGLLSWIAFLYSSKIGKYPITGYMSSVSAHFLYNLFIT